MTRSWIASANEQGCDFPADNLPFGVFRPGQAEALRAELLRRGIEAHGYTAFQFVFVLLQAAALV